ncbi:hypothetical protein QJS66_19390 [Kocuria rhizophila]|nr:hypothetical protein QJS66_19390 [Kocuria rhizophila]
MSGEHKIIPTPAPGGGGNWQWCSPSHRHAPLSAQIIGAGGLAAWRCWPMPGMFTDSAGAAHRPHRRDPGAETGHGQTHLGVPARPSVAAAAQASVLLAVGGSSPSKGCAGCWSPPRSSSRPCCGSGWSAGSATSSGRPSSPRAGENLTRRPRSWRRPTTPSGSVAAIVSAIVIATTGAAPADARSCP